MYSMTTAKLPSMRVVPKKETKQGWRSCESTLASARNASDASKFLTTLTATFVPSHEAAKTWPMPPWPILAASLMSHAGIS